MTLMKLSTLSQLLLTTGLTTTTGFVPMSRGSVSFAPPRNPSRSTLFSTTTSSEFSSLTVADLKELLRANGSKVSGNKSELIERLSSLEDKDEEKAGEKVKVKVGGKALKVKGGEKAFKVKAGEKAKVKAGVKAEVKALKKVRKSNRDIMASTENAKSFSDIGVPPVLVERLSEMGLTVPTPIQKSGIPHAILGRDVMGLAQTGTGKTMAFGVPLVAQMMESSRRPRPKSVRGLVLAPTRELANQIAVQLRTLTKNTPIDTFVVVGGQNIKTQINKLKGGTDLLVATPGRLIDLMDRGALTLGDASFLVLDEADLMLDMGFLPSLRKIAKMLPKKRQTMLFSATMSKNMNEVANSYLKDPIRVEVARAGKTADKVTQELHFIPKPDKLQKLLELIDHHRDDRALVFGRTKHGMEKLCKKLCAAGYKAGSIHGNKSQPQRDRAIAAFKSGEIKVLVATDVAARGLDIPDVKHVYNYELPNVPEAYVHRIGRTGRAGKDGAAIAFCSMEEMDDLLLIQKVTGFKIPVVSGTPWTKSESTFQKDKIKNDKSKQKQQHIGNKKSKNISTGSGNSWPKNVRSDDRNNKQKKEYRQDRTTRSSEQRRTGGAARPKRIPEKARRDDVALDNRFDREFSDVFN